MWSIPLCLRYTPAVVGSGGGSVCRTGLPQCHGAGNLPARRGERRGGELPLRRQGAAVCRRVALCPPLFSRKYPPDMGLSLRQPRRTVTRLCPVLSVARLDQGRPAWRDKLLARELIEPTAALEKLVEEEFRPRAAYLEAIVQSLWALTLRQNRFACRPEYCRAVPVLSQRPQPAGPSCPPRRSIYVHGSTAGTAYYPVLARGSAASGPVTRDESL